jgi:hypothetical protein
VFRPAPNQPEKAAQTEALPEPRTASVGRRSVQKRKEKCNEAQVERIYIAVVAAAPGYSIPRSEVLENCLPLFTAESQSANEWVCSSDDVAGAAAAVFQLRQSAELSRSTYVGACVTSDERLTATAFCTGLARSSTSGRQIMCNKRLAELLQVDASSACVASIRPVKPQTLNGRLAYKVQLVKTTKMPKLMKEDDGADGAFLTSTPDETHDGQDGGAIEAVDSDDDADGEEPILALEEDSPSQLGANEAEEDDEEFPVMMTDAEAQCTDVVILSNDEFNSLKRGTPTAPPLRPYSGSSSHGIPKKVEKGLPPSRPSTASMQRITASLGYELPNRDYEGAVMRLCWALHRSHQADDSTIMLSRQGDLTTPRLLIQLAALCNVRFLLGLRESDQEQQLKLQAVSALSSLLSIFGCTDSATLPSPVPYFVVSDWRPEMASAAPPATAISDAFAPLISAIADACQNNSRSRPKKHAAADLEALMGKVTELDEMLRAATRRAGIAGAPPPATKALTLAPDSKDLPPLARARLPSMIDDGVDSDGDPEHEGLDNGRARRLIQRVLVKPLARTASIRKTITLDQKKVSQEVDAPSVMRTPPQPLRPLQAAQRRDDAAEAIVRRSNSPPLSQAKKRGLQPLGGSSAGMAPWAQGQGLTSPWAQGQGLTSPLSPGLLSTPVLTGITEAFVERFGNSPRSL